ncbi:glycosyltransferase family 2 protein [Aurantiacibacter rhizosphaerae]|uniref:Glycosyltransferase n=1 Tax=Aurantiacibacter rhizosphaerae TaxID=2691582 RepID=A0A844XAJ0_9SPHN|nr:glycosyltransferase family A protein [Aurantiacibacter rhizosphaerae]MWV26976.1 glycosyltransferase [Aurantiacibacter rhizosphaerae]
MTSAPPVSVITTAYNREAYLGDAIESVLASSFEDFEYIVVDDCSSDATFDLAQRYAAMDSRVRVYRNEVNLGDYKNRHYAATLAQGTYLKYVDSDDVIYPHGLQVMMQSASRFPDAGLALSCKPEAQRSYPVALSPREAYRRHFFEGGLFNNGPLSTLIKRDAYHAAGGFTGEQFIGDAQLWLAIARDALVILMPQDLTWWRSHGEQELAYELRTLDTVAARHSLAINSLRDTRSPLSDAETQRALDIVQRKHASLILSVARRFSFAQAFKLAQTLGLSTGDFVHALSSRLTKGRKAL